MKHISTSWMALRRDDKIYLGLKKHKFGQGLINGIGGKAQLGENILETAVRETLEEIGVCVLNCKKVATIYFPNIFYNGNFANITMHCFIATDWEGEPCESDEMAPCCFSVDQIPYERMFADDKVWLPRVLAGEKVKGEFRFDKNMNLLEQQVTSDPSDLMFELYDSDFGLADGFALDYKVREAARTILLDDKDHVGLMHAKNRGIYKLTGGGVNPGETALEALHREVIEEAGFKIQQIEKLGTVLEYRNKFSQTNVSHCFIAHAADFVGNHLMPDEIKDGFELEWFESLDHAIETLKKIKAPSSDYSAMFFVRRELDILHYADDRLRAKTKTKNKQ